MKDLVAIHNADSFDWPVNQGSLFLKESYDRMDFK